MNAPIPFGFPGPTMLYLGLYLVTWVIHVVFMNYVVAGTFYLVVCSLSPSGQPLASPLAKVLRDWLPLMLSAAITAGVAPLLFVQILYQQEFYTANLLLFNRWMSILPALIVAFYLMYLLRSKRFPDWNVVIRGLVALCTMAMLAFIGWSWTENHLLSINRTVWVEMYKTEPLLYVDRLLWTRATLWLVGTFPTFALLVAWQLWYARRNDPAASPEPEARRCALIALAGLALATVLGVVNLLLVPPTPRDFILGSAGLVYVVAAGVGVFIEASAWGLIYARRRLHWLPLSLDSVGLALALFGVAGVREAYRISQIELVELFDRHAEAARVGGMGVFLAFFVTNGLLIAGCFWLVRRGLKRDESASR